LPGAHGIGRRKRLALVETIHVEITITSLPPRPRGYSPRPVAERKLSPAVSVLSAVPSFPITVPFSTSSLHRLMHWNPMAVPRVRCVANDILCPAYPRLVMALENGSCVAASIVGHGAQRQCHLGNSWNISPCDAGRASWLNPEGALSWRRRVLPRARYSCCRALPAESGP